MSYSGRPQLLAALLLACWLESDATAQVRRTPESAAFEVATVKPLASNSPRESGVHIYPGGRVVISDLSLKALVATAFRTSYWQISGGEEWVEKERYLIEAKPAEAARPRIQDLGYTLFGIEDQTLREMLQALLADRFQLKIRRETSTGDVYLLKRSGRKLRLSQSEGASAAQPRFGSIGYAAARWVISRSTMAQLAKFASDYVFHAPVIDQTELSGSFDYVQPTADLDPNYTDNSESFRRLLPEMGLTLERSKGPIERLVIESASRPLPN